MNIKRQSTYDNRPNWHQNSQKSGKIETSKNELRDVWDHFYSILVIAKTIERNNKLLETRRTKKRNKTIAYLCP